MKDSSFYIIFNAYHDAVEYKIPPEKYGRQWEKLLMTGNGSAKDKSRYRPGDFVHVEGRTVIVLQRTN